MGWGFKETAHLNTNKEKYDESYDRIFGKKSAAPTVTKLSHRDVMDFLNNLNTHMMNETDNIFFGHITEFISTRKVEVNKFLDNLESNNENN